MPDHPDSATLEEALVLPLILPKGTDPAVVSSLHDALDRAIAMTLSADQAQMLERADRMAELLTGLFVPNDALLEDRLHRAQTVVKALNDGEWLTAEQLNALQASPPANKSHPASDWKRRSRIFSVSYGDAEWFAGYQFDSRHQPLPIIKDVLKALGKVADPWNIAAWFHFPNGWIAKRATDGSMRPVAPKDALDMREAVLHAAAQRQSSYTA
ncbi:MAG: hypothetical protein L0H15_04715 [Nitrosospira sp.]|nr:hypothetical protein [Nitrosospira sp.]